MSENDDVVSFEEIDLEESGEEIESEESSEEKESVEVKSEESSNESEEEESSSEKSEEESKEESSEEKAASIELSDALKEKGFEVDEEGNLGLKYKADGEDKFIKIEDLQSHEAGSTNWNQKNSEFAEEKKQWTYEKNAYEREKSITIGDVNKFVEAVNKSDSDGAINALASLAHTDGLSLRQHFISLMENQARSYWKLSDEERKEFDKDEKIRHYEQTQDVRQEELSATRETADLQQKITNFQLKYKLDDSELVDLNDQVIKDLGEDYDLDTYLAALETQHTDGITQGKASQLLESIDPALKDNSEYVKEVNNFIKQNPGISDEEVTESIKQALSEDKDASKETKPDQGKSKSAINEKMAKNDKGRTKEQGTVDTDDLDDVTDFEEVSHVF